MQLITYKAQKMSKKYDSVDLVAPISLSQKSIVEVEGLGGFQLLLWDLRGVAPGGELSQSPCKLLWDY